MSQLYRRPVVVTALTALATLAGCGHSQPAAQAPAPDQAAPPPAPVEAAASPAPPTPTAPDPDAAIDAAG